MYLRKQFQSRYFTISKYFLMHYILYHILDTYIKHFKVNRVNISQILSTSLSDNVKRVKLW